MELVARVLITIPDDKWQEFLTDEIETKKEKLEKDRDKYGELTFSYTEKRIPETALRDMKYELEDTLRRHFTVWGIKKPGEFIEFEESEVKENAGKS